MDNEIDPIELKLKALSLRGRGDGQGDEGLCPDDEIFGAFMDGLLEEGEAEKVKTHILQCGDCHLAYSTWVEMSRQENPTVPAHLLEAARNRHKPSAGRIILKLMKKAFEILNPRDDLLMPSLRPDAAAVRGQSTLPENQYEIVDIQPHLPYLEGVRIQHLQDTGAVKLTLIPSAEAAPDRLKKIRADLHAGNDLVQSWPLFEDGTSLNPIEKGLYKLELLELSDSGESDSTRSLGFVELELRD